MFGRVPAMPRSPRRPLSGSLDGVISEFRIAYVGVWSSSSGFRPGLLPPCAFENLCFCGLTSVDRSVCHACMARTRVEPNPVSGFAAACRRGAATITSTRSFSATVEICRTCILRARFSRSCPISPKLQDVLLWGTGFVPHKNPKSVHLWRLKARPRISIAKRSQTQPSRLDQVGLEEVCKARLGFPQALGSDLVYARFRRTVWACRVPSGVLAECLFGGLGYQGQEPVFS